jgi:N-terminal acetyltransferase B complex non-catalytic subunit
MASNRQEAEVIERKLRPVYDALDNGQNKKVIQMAEKILKKTPSLYCAKALQAIALVRLGRNDDSYKVINDIISSRPGDSATLQAVYMYCRELGDYKKLVELYEAVVISYPSNEEILTHHFMSYIRVNDYQKQQKAAVQLVKAFPKSGPYYCWRVMSLVLQAHQLSTDEDQKKMCLSLAERLMEKYISENKVESEAEVRLYVTILQSLDEPTKILSRVLNNDALRNKVRSPEEVLDHELKCLNSLGYYDELAEKLALLISKDSDQWNYIKMYITAQIERSKACTVDEGGTSGSHSPLVEMKALLDGLVAKEKEKSSRHFRSPYLSHLEAIRQLKENKIDYSHYDTLHNLLELYFTLFASKNCCYDDLYLYIDLLTKDDQIKLLQVLSLSCDKDPVDFNCDDSQISFNVSKLYRDISLLKLQRHCGLHQCLTVEGKRLLVKDLLQKFQGGLALGQSLSKTVNQHSDFYAILACHLWIEIYQETNDPAELWGCVVMLEGARKVSCSNPQLQLLLVKLYGYLNMVDPIISLYNTLSVKHVQVDSLGYITNRYVQATGGFRFAKQMFEISLKFYISCNKETSDYIINAYKNGMFHKILEIINLRDRICNSYGFYILGVESMIQDFMYEVNSLDSAKNFFLKEKFGSYLPITIDDIENFPNNLWDNRDMSVMEDWSPPDQRLTEKETNLTFQLDILWVKIRLLVMCTLKELVGVATTPTTNGVVKKLKSLESLLTEAETHEGINFWKNKKCPLLPIQAPPTPLLFLFVDHGYSTLLRRLVHMLIQILTSHDHHVMTLVNELIDLLKGSMAGINGFTPDLIKSDYNSLLEVKIDLEHYVMFIIVSSWLVVFLGVCLAHLSPQKSSKKKKKSRNTQPAAVPANVKADDGATPNPTDDRVTSIVNMLAELKTTLASVSSLFQILPVDESSVLLQKLSLNDSSAAERNDIQIKCEVCAGIVESYNISFKDCNDIVESKISFISSLIQSYGIMGLEHDVS